MRDAIELTTPAQWKAVSHPLRVGVLGLLAGEARTNEELARALGVASGKLYFHTKRLLDAGLIEPAGTRQKGPLTEKLYRAVARRFVAPPPSKSGDAPPFEPLLASALELYRSTWHENGLVNETELAFHLVLPHTGARRDEFVRRLRALFDDFQQAAAPANDPAATPLAIAVLMHSVSARSGGQEDTPEEKP